MSVMRTLLACSALLTSGAHALVEGEVSPSRSLRGAWANPSPAAVPADDEQQDTSTIGIVAECWLCMEEITEDEQHSTSCGHTFHKSCIDTWYATAVRNSCPMCRQTDMNGPDFTPGSGEISDLLESFQSPWITDGQRARRLPKAREAITEMISARREGEEIRRTSNERRVSHYKPLEMFLHKKADDWLDRLEEELFGWKQNGIHGHTFHRLNYELGKRRMKYYLKQDEEVVASNSPDEARELLEQSKASGNAAVAFMKGKLGVLYNLRSTLQARFDDFEDDEYVVNGDIWDLQGLVSQIRNWVEWYPFESLDPHVDWVYIRFWQRVVNTAADHLDNEILRSQGVRKDAKARHIDWEAKEKAISPIQKAARNRAKRVQTAVNNAINSIFED